MKRTAVFALMIPLLLSGCARREEAGFDAFRETLDGREVAFTAEVTSLDPQNALTYTADALCRDGETVVSVTAPESIAGITLRRDGEDSITYDGAVLVLTGEESAVSPAYAVPLLWEALSRGRCLWYGHSREASFVALAGQDGVTVTVWFDREHTCPRSAEIAENGRNVLALALHRWQIKE